jgi:chromosome segregation ATPase
MKTPSRVDEIQSQLEDLESQLEELQAGRAEFPGRYAALVKAGDLARATAAKREFEAGADEIAGLEIRQFDLGVDLLSAEIDAAQATLADFSAITELEAIDQQLFELGRRRADIYAEPGRLSGEIRAWRMEADELKRQRDRRIAQHLRSSGRQPQPLGRRPANVRG